MKALVALLATAGVLATPVAMASPKDIASKSACLGCHAVDKKVVGPSFKDIAAKYTGQADASAKLVKKVKAGGSGVWGPIPMPANAGISEADTKAVIDWILAGAK